MQHLLIENKAAKLKLNESVHKESMDRLVEEINKVFGAKAFEDGKVSGEITNCIQNAVDTLDIDIHSPGGSVLDGYVLYNTIKDARERGIYVTAYVTLAASMASVIAMAADKIVMRKGGRMMIHEASAMTQGDADEHRNRAELLDGISDEIAGIYSERTGKDKEEMRKLMKKETWMDADEAIRLGFADAKFDNKEKSKTMNILDRLTNPSDIEAKERIIALEAQIAANDEVAADFQAKLEQAENALQEATTELVGLKSSKESAEAKAAELEAKVAELEESIKALGEKAEETEEKVAAKASEILAEQGHPAPVAIEAEEQVETDHIKVLATLKGAERTAYYNQFKKEIRKNLK